jgi:ligand-binding sensor domain-containing protein
MLLPCILFGQTEGLYFNRLTTDQNLTSQLYCADIFQDKNGFLWIGTQTGLNRFDGKVVRQYLPDASNARSMADEIIQGKFHVDRQGNMFFSTFKAINRYFPERDSFSKILVDHSGEIYKQDYELLYVEHDANKLWVQVDTNLFIHDTRSNKSDKLGMAPPHNNNKHGFTSSGDHCLYVPNGYDLDVLVYKNGNEVNRWKLKLPGAGREPIQHVTTQGLGKLWVGTSKGIYYFNGLEFVGEVSTFNGAPLGGIVDMADMGNGNFLVASANKLFVYDTASCQIVAEMQGIFDGEKKTFASPIEKVYVGRDKSVWVFCHGKGVWYASLNKRKMTPYLQDNNMPGMVTNSVKSLTVGKGGQLWCLTDGGIFVMNKFGAGYKIAKMFSTDELPAWNTAFYITTLKNGSIAVCTNNGFYISKDANGQFLEVRTKDNVKLASTYTGTLSSGQVLVASMEKGMYELVDRNGQFMIKPFLAVKDNTPYTLFFEDSNYVYFYKNLSSIEAFNKGEGNKLSFCQSIDFASTINDVVLGSDCNIWMATSAGLFKINSDGKEIKITQDTKIPSIVLNAIEEDLTGNFWLGSTNGLLKYHPNHKVHVFKQEDGIQSLEFNMWSSTIFDDGTLAFGGVNGMNIFHPSSIKPNPKPPYLHFYDLEVNDNEIVPSAMLKGGEYIFNPDQTTLKFNYVGIDFSSPEDVRYMYWLKGHETEVVDAGKTGFAKYVKLPHGAYTFCVWAISSDGIPTSNPISFKFRILPPIYLRWWALLLEVLLIFGALCSAYKYRIRQIRKKEEDLRKEEELKRRVAESRQLAAEMQNTVLRLQMNPHFIFNSLNSISRYILDKDIETANDYLGRFSSLMRSILNLAAKPHIYLSDEIELMELYIKTEAMRFEQKFEHKIILDGTIDPDEVLIPTMIVQPFVENAIWHGLSSKQGHGMIQITFEKQGQSLVCSVEDNGKGRASTAKEKGSKHESKALKITEQRLKSLSEETGNPTSFEIVDLLDKDGNPSGTKVVIKIPYTKA